MGSPPVGGGAMGYPKNGLSPEVDNNHDDVLLGVAVGVGGRGSKFSTSGSRMRNGCVGCIGSSRSAKDGRDPPNSIGSLSINKYQNFGDDRRSHLPWGRADAVKHSINSLFDGKNIRERVASGSKRLIEVSLKCKIEKIAQTTNKHT